MYRYSMSAITASRGKVVRFKMLDLAWSPNCAKWALEEWSVGGREN